MCQYTIYNPDIETFSVDDDFVAAYFRLWNITSQMLLNCIPIYRKIVDTATIRWEKNGFIYIANRRQLSAEKMWINKYNKMYKNKNKGISKWEREEHITNGKKITEITEKMNE